MTAFDIFLAGFVFKDWALAIFIMVSLYGSYIRFFIYMRMNREILDKPATKAKYGNLYEGLKPLGRYAAP